MNEWNDSQLKEFAAQHGTPCFVYSRRMLEDRAKSYSV